MNVVDYFYKMIDTRVVVTNLIVWDRKDNGITANLDAETSLGHFTTYTREEIFMKMKLRYDHASFLTVGDVQWDNTLGVAYLGHLCNIDSTGVNRVREYFNSSKIIT